MENQQYSLTRFWRYVFTPLIILTLAFVWYVVFSLPATQLSPRLPVVASVPVATAPGI